MYQNYVSYVPTYTSSVMVKVDTMKVQKEEAAKEREKESKKGSKKNSKNNTDTSSDGNGGKRKGTISSNETGGDCTLYPFRTSPFSA